MKTFYLFLIVGCCTLLPAPSLPAQAPSPSPAPAVAPISSPEPTPQSDKKFKKDGGLKRGLLKNLSPEDRQKIEQTRQAAKADPVVQSAAASGDKRAMRQALRRAMLQKDPSVAPVLEKMRSEAKQALGGAGKMRDGGKMEERLSYLPADERTKLLSASRAAQSDPQVTTLRQAWTSAATSAAKAEAGKALRAGVRDTILRNDPSLAPVLQKVQEHREAQAGELNF